MGSRFLISGCQLGMIKGFISVNDEGTRKEALKEIEKILFHQCIGSSNKLISHDCKILIEKGDLTNE